MSTLNAVAPDAFYLGKHTFAIAFERQRMDAPQHLPVSLCNCVCHSADSHIVEAECE